MFKPKMHLFVDFIKKHFEFTSCIAPSCLFGMAGMQIFCRGTVYAKGAKGDIFMYTCTIIQFGPEQTRYAALNRKICAVCTNTFVTTNFAFD